MTLKKWQPSRPKTRCDEEGCIWDKTLEPNSESCFLSSHFVLSEAVIFVTSQTGEMTGFWLPRVWQHILDWHDLNNFSNLVSSQNVHPSFHSARLQSKIYHKSFFLFFRFSLTCRQNEKVLRSVGNFPWHFPRTYYHFSICNHPLDWHFQPAKRSVFSEKWFVKDSINY